MGTMVKSALILKGPPRPAFYDGLLVQSIVPDSIPETVDGWRNIDANGEKVLPAECFVACNQFFVSKRTRRPSRSAGPTGIQSLKRAMDSLPSPCSVVTVR